MAAEPNRTDKPVKKPVKPTKPPVVEPAEVKTPVVVDKKRSWSVGSLFWGLLLVVIGGLFLLGNLGIVEFDWMELWRLWPLLIVGTGFSVLATTHWIWKVLSVIFLFASLAAIVYVGTGNYQVDSEPIERQLTTVSREGNATKAHVEIDAGASRLMIDSSTNKDVATATLESSWLVLKKESEMDGTTQNVRLASDGAREWWRQTPQRNDWNVRLTDSLPLTLDIDAGASRTTADLSHVRVTELNLKAGASSTDIKLGNKTDIAVDIDSGASSLTLRVPKNSGVLLVFDGGLSSKELDNLKEVAENEYRTDNFEGASHKITINVDAGLSSFKIERY